MPREIGLSVFVEDLVCDDSVQILGVEQKAVHVEDTCFHGGPDEMHRCLEGSMINGRVW